MNRSLVIPLFFALGLLLVSLATYGIFYSMVQAEGTKADQLAAQIVSEHNETAQAAQAKEELATLTNEEGTVTQYFVSTTNIVPFLESLQSIGSYLGSTVQVASVSANSGDPYGTLDLSLSITGPFDSVLRTLGAIEFEPYNVSITSLTLNEGAEVNSAISSTTNTSSESALPSWTASATFVVGAQTGTSTAASTAATGTPLDQLNTFGLPPTTNQPSLQSSSTASSTHITAPSTSASSPLATSTSSSATSSVPHPLPAP
jgi:hypothetical protein